MGINYFVGVNVFTCFAVQFADTISYGYGYDDLITPHRACGVSNVI